MNEENIPAEQEKKQVDSRLSHSHEHSRRKKSLS